MATTQNLGHATAYGYAVAGGYTGTEEEFEALMADYGSVAEAAEASAEDAEAWAVGQRGGEDVDEDDDTYNNNSEYYAGQASNYSGQASTYASNASDYADSASDSASTAAAQASAAAASASAAADSATAAANVFTAAGDYSFSLDEDGMLWLNITFDDEES